MKSWMRHVLGILAAVGMLCAVKAHANMVTSINGGTLLPFPAANLITGDPQTVAPGVTWSSTQSRSVYGWTDRYGFVDNDPQWVGPPMVGLNSSVGAMTFSFATPVSAVGGIINWVHFNNGTIPDGIEDAIISVFDPTHTLIESFQLSNTTVTNLVTPNSFYGFSESTPNISYFTLRGDGIGLRDLTV